MARRITQPQPRLWTGFFYGIGAGMFIDGTAMMATVKSIPNNIASF